VLTFILRRIVALIPLLFLVSIIVFGLVLLVPGDAATKLAGGEDASPQQIEQVRTELGLDRPFLTQYVDWLQGAVRLDLGDSLYSKQPVVSEIWDRVPVTLQIACSSGFRWGSSRACDRAGSATAESSWSRASRSRSRASGSR
jgi:peptide/nickel transport system permease protein